MSLNYYKNKFRKNIKNDKQTIKINPFSFQLMDKLSFNNIYFYHIGDTFRSEIISVHELANKKIGILTKFYLFIYSLKNFKIFQAIILDLNSKDEKEIYDLQFIDFIVLKNKNLVIWNK